ncbi:MAG: hypothetical protein ABJV68_15280 [Paracoccaceae bacterium]
MKKILKVVRSMNYVPDQMVGSPAVLLVPVFGLWNNDFCLHKEGFVGGLICDAFGGRGDVCLAGTRSGIILV